MAKWFIVLLCAASLAGVAIAEEHGEANPCGEQPTQEETAD